MENKSGIYPKGHRVLIKAEEVEELTEGGILLPTEIQKREQLAEIRGRVVEIGSTAYSDQVEPFCKVGDRVIFAKYSGIVYGGKDGVEYRVINDLDIVAVIDEESEWTKKTK